MSPFRRCYGMVVAYQWIEIKAAVRTDNVANQRRYPYQTAYLPLASPSIFGALFLDLYGEPKTVSPKIYPWSAIKYSRFDSPTRP